LRKPKARWTEAQIRRKIQRWLSAQFLAELIRYQLDLRDGHWHLQFDFDHAAWLRLMDRVRQRNYRVDRVAIGLIGSGLPRLRA
jgi:hypothetical protein